MNNDVSIKLLCVLPAVPLPANTGGALRTLHLIQALDSDFDVTVLVPHREGTEAEEFRRMLRGRVVVVPNSTGVKKWMARGEGVLRGNPIGYEQYAGAALKKVFSRLFQEQPFGLVHFDHLHTAQLLPVAKKLNPAVRVVIDAHNVEAQIVERMARISSLPMRMALKWQAARVRALEAALMSEADAVLACSTRDRSLLKWSGARKVQVVPNGVAVSELAHSAVPLVRRNVIFVGSMDWWPNFDAAMRLVKEIWPLCAQRLGESRLVIAGRNPPEELVALGNPRVEITGTLESVAPHLLSSWASAIPLRAGSGTRLKILEAAAARVPVVATRLAAEGLPLVNGKHVLFAESSEEFAGALRRLWEDPSLAKQLADAAFEVAQQFDWGQIARNLTNFYRSWLAGPPVSQVKASAGA